jgi:hypothetical protein
MAQIAGIKKHKAASGKVTHVTLSVRHWGHMLEDILDSLEIAKARKSGSFVDWDEAKKSLDKKFGFNKNPKRRVQGNH